MPKYIYTEEIKEFVKNNCKGLFNQQLTDLVNQTFGTCYTVEQIGRLKRRNGYTSGLFGENGQFPKGHTMSKGRKMTPEQYEKVKPTMFHKGHNRNKQHKIGDESLNGSGYIVVKVADDPYKRRGNWKLKHHIIYEKHYGEIPKGYQVIFADGNNRNFDKDNLVLVSRAEVLYLNHYGMRYKDADLTKAAAMIAKIETTIYKKKRGEK